MERHNLINGTGDESSSCTSGNDEPSDSSRLKDFCQPSKQSGGQLKLRKEMSLLYAVIMVAGSIIGSGIFFTPNKTLEHAGSAAASLCVWIVAGLSACLSVRLSVRPSVRLSVCQYIYFKYNEVSIKDLKQSS